MNDKLDNLIDQAAHLVEIDRWREAIELLLVAQSIEPGNTHVNSLLSQAHLGLGNKKEALKYADLAVASAPDEEWGHRLRSVALSGLGRKADALDAAREAARIDPEEAFTMSTLANAQLESGLVAEAEVTAEKLRELHPYLELSHFTLGNVFLQKGDHRSAEKCFRAALEINPLSSESRNNLAIAILRKSDKSAKPVAGIHKLSILDTSAAADPDEIHRHLGEAIKLDPTSEVAKQNFRNQFRYAFPVYLAIGLVPFWIMVAFVNPFWAVIWTLIFLFSVLQAFREVRNKRKEIADDLKPILDNLPKLSFSERLEELWRFVTRLFRKTWPAYAVVLGAVILRQIDFGGGPPPTYRSTWNVGLSSLMVLGAAFWFNHLLSKDDLD